MAAEDPNHDDHEGSAAVAPFGTLPSGEEVAAVTLRAGALEAVVIGYGAALQRLMVPDAAGVPDDIVLGHDELAGYLAARDFFGATVGRVANRIAGAAFALDGRRLALAANEGPTMLHGGPEGFDRRNWRVAALGPGASVRFELVSPDGDQGFPGRLTAWVSYRLTPAGLEILHEAETDAPTPVALAHHSYFALAGARRLAAHPGAALEAVLTVPAARYLPVDARKIPHAPVPVAGTPFDFRSPQRIGARLGPDLPGYDHNLCLDEGWLRLDDPLSGRRMEIFTDQPGVQFYTAEGIDGVRGKAGHRYHASDALCLEPQAWPDAVNRDGEGGRDSVILRPGARYRAVTRLAFGRIDAAG